MPGVYRVPTIKDFTMQTEQTTPTEANTSSHRGADGRIKQTAFRLEPPVLDDLDTIAGHLSRETGSPQTRADAVRFAARAAARNIRKSSKKKAE